MSRNAAARSSTRRTASARVVGGKIVTRAKFPEGTKLIVQVDEPPAPVTLTEEDEVAIAKAITSVRSGKGVPLEKVRAILRRL